ncbi:hypothetical protein [Streptomyces sp. 2224.1]|uniref:hypothetical protein n=1 Tax=Streptomyces sp. 2224.1 TaxID=1881020 RepID=UPI001160678A|nr:hypothetical protein [Streptomyces sp. 2224.1]
MWIVWLLGSFVLLGLLGLLPPLGPLGLLLHCSGLLRLLGSMELRLFTGQLANCHDVRFDVAHSGLPINPRRTRHEEPIPPQA